jgi:hypothetical protein
LIISSSQAAHLRRLLHLLLNWILCLHCKI